MFTTIDEANRARQEGRGYWRGENATDRLYFELRPEHVEQAMSKMCGARRVIYVYVLGDWRPVFDDVPTVHRCFQFVYVHGVKQCIPITRAAIERMISERTA